MSWRWLLSFALVALGPSEARTPTIASPAEMPNLTREMTEAERAYFGRPLAGVVRAINVVIQAHKKAPCTVSGSDHKFVNIDDPASLVPGPGLMSPDGLIPSKWHVFVACPELGMAMVELRPSPYVTQSEDSGTSDRMPGDGIVERGEDFLLLNGTTMMGKQTQELIIGKFSKQSGAWVVPEDIPVRARPVVISLSQDYPSGKKLTDVIDLTTARAALASVERLPLLRSTVERAGVKGTPEERLQAELSAYAFLLTRDGARPEVVIESWAEGGGWLSPEAAQVLPRLAQNLRGSAIADYCEKNRETGVFPTGLEIAETKVTLLSKEESASYFEKREEGWDGWKEFRKVHDEAPIVSFSRVGLSNDLSQAVVSVGWSGDWLSGSGALYFLGRKGDSWEVLYEVPLWVS